MKAGNRMGRPPDWARGRLGAMLGAGMLLWAAGALGQAPRQGSGQVAENEPLLKGLTNFIQASGKMPPTPLTSDQEQQVLDAVFSRFPNVDSHAMMGYISEHFPDEMQRYTLLAMQNLGDAMTLLMGLVRDSLELQDLETRRPEQYALTVRYQQLERRAQQLSAQRRDSQGDAQAAAVAELRNVLAEAFEVKQTLMRGDVAAVQGQVDALQKLLQERAQNRESILARRMEELAGGAEVGW